MRTPSKIDLRAPRKSDTRREHRHELIPSRSIARGRIDGVKVEAQTVCVAFVRGSNKSERAGQRRIVIVRTNTTLVVRFHVIYIDYQNPGVGAAIATQPLSIHPNCLSLFYVPLFPAVPQLNDCSNETIRNPDTASTPAGSIQFMDRHERSAIALPDLRQSRSTAILRQNTRALSSGSTASITPSETISVA
jgi:hypothetical protein